jgi:hypothetical protein
MDADIGVSDIAALHDGMWNAGVCCFTRASTQRAHMNGFY